MILGIFVALMVVSFVAAVALYAVFIVALVFAIRYLINYRKTDKKDVSKIPAAFYKQWWFYALIISFIFIVGSSLANGSNNSTDQSSNNLESKNLKLSFDSKKIETNDKGNATISGKTEKGASIVAGTIHTDTADDEGKFSVTYPLTSATEKTINITATGKNGDSKVLKVTIIPSKTFSDNEKSKLESEKKASTEKLSSNTSKEKNNSSSQNNSLVKVNNYLTGSLKENKKFAESNNAYDYARYAYSIKFKNSDFNDLQVTVYKGYLDLPKSKRKEVINSIKGSAISAAMINNVNQKAIDKMNNDGLVVSLKFY